MPNYQEYACPVCKKPFQKDDDIVTCPECGTPHHRECYNLIGACVNKGLHQSGYSFLESEKTISKENENQEYYVPGDSENEEIEELVKKKEPEGESQGGKGFFPFAPIQFDTDEYKGSGKIGDYDVADVAATIRSNVPKFIKKFKKMEEQKKKISWNWSGFFFGSFYLLFRKMYKYGIAVFCIAISIIFSFEALIYKMAPNAIAQMQKLVEDAYATKATTIDFSSLASIPDMQNAIKISYALIGILFLIHIFVAMFADNLYKNTIFNIIKNVNERLDSGANFTQATIVFGQTGSMNQQQLRKMYLANKGGVTIFAPFLAYSLFQFLITFI